MIDTKQSYMDLHQKLNYLVISKERCINNLNSIPTVGNLKKKVFGDELDPKTIKPLKYVFWLHKIDTF